MSDPAQTEPPAEGSILDKRVAADLLAERAKCNFDRKEMTLWLWRHQENLDQQRGWLEDMRKAPDLLPAHHRFYEMTPDEQREHLGQRMLKLSEIDRAKYFTEFDPMRGPSFGAWLDCY